MRLRDLIPVALIAGIGAFIWTQRPASKPAPAAPAASAAPTRDAERAQDQPPPAVVVHTTAASTSPTRDDAEISRRVQAGAPGTYIIEMLAEQKQMLQRWPEKQVEPLRVWIERTSTIDNWSPKYPVVAEHAFEEWRAAGFPMRFEIAPDSAGASIKILWSSQFPAGGRQIGVTNKMRDQDGWILEAEIIIATHDTRGGPLPPETIAGVARHEVGHALGLGHSPSKTDVMYPESTTPVISGPDRATLHLLYSLPPGLVK